MMTANLRTFRMATACLFAATGLTPGLAQDFNVNTGIVRISDSKGMAAKSVSHTTVQSGVQSGQGVVYDGGAYVDGNCPHCQSGKLKSGMFKERYCTHSPDHGYSVPGKWPIQRRGVEYQHMFPPSYYSVYTGAPWMQAAPQIYQPTDTTQLGYYYQHVPFWQPNPNILPARPVPAQWHTYAPVVYASQHGRSYTKGGGVIEGHMHQGDVIYTSPATTTPTATPTQLQPVPETVVPPAPKPIMESAVPLPLERVGFEN